MQTAKHALRQTKQNWNAHNAFILVTNAGGLLALVSYTAIFLWLLYRLVCINITARSDEELALARGLLMFYLVVIVALQFTSEYIEMIFWMYAALVETLAVKTIKGIPGSFSRTSTRRNKTANT